MPDAFACRVRRYLTAFLLSAAVLTLSGCLVTREVPRWGLFEVSFTAATELDDPFHDVDLFVTFTSPSRRTATVRAFWDGGRRWRVRFSPDEEGAWTYVTRAEPADVEGLHEQMGTFRVGPPSDHNRFAQHGPVRVAQGKTWLEHADGTPFFWLADTAWNGPLKATDDEWDDYLEIRLRQGFSAVQWVTTQWRAAPDGDREGVRAYAGSDRIRIDVEFFQRLDRKVEAIERAGLLNLPVLLWAIGSGSDPSVNPGHALPEDEAARLAQYMIARWQGYPSVWILAGDGDYRGEKATRWQRIGRAVFDGITHAPALMHPGGMQWVLQEFADEPWVGIHGYQSGHGDDEAALRWITSGPPARDWSKGAPRPFINLEPPYENHLAYQSRRPITADAVRRAVYWSLLNAPTAGVSYGGHGVWGWDDGTRPPVDHDRSGVPLPWREALRMPGAEQMRHVVDTFTAIEFWRLRPRPEVLLDQPGVADPAAFVAVSGSVEGDLFVAYTPKSQSLTFHADALPRDAAATWVDPRTGRRSRATAIDRKTLLRFEPPADGDWLLVILAVL